MLGSCLVLGAGCVWIGIMSYKQYKQMKEAERKALEEEFPDDGEYYEEEAEEAEEE